MPLVCDELWERVEPLPPKTARQKGGRPPIPDRDVLGRIIFVLGAGIPWG